MTGKLIEGSITLKDVEDLVVLLNDKWKREFKLLMEYRKTDENLIKLRFSQIERYFKLKGITKIVQSFMKISQEFQLKGDFSELNSISSMVILISKNFFTIKNFGNLIDSNRK